MKIYSKIPQITVVFSCAGLFWAIVALFSAKLSFNFIYVLLFGTLAAVHLIKDKQEVAFFKADRIKAFLKTKIYLICSILVALLNVLSIIGMLSNGGEFGVGLLIFAHTVAHILCFISAVKHNKKIRLVGIILLSLVALITVLLSFSADVFTVIYITVRELIILAAFVMGYCFTKDSNYVDLFLRLDTLKTDHSKGTINDSEYDEAVRAALADL